MWLKKFIKATCKKSQRLMLILCILRQLLSVGSYKLKLVRFFIIAQTVYLQQRNIKGKQNETKWLKKKSTKQNVQHFYI